MPLARSVWVWQKIKDNKNSKNLSPVPFLFSLHLQTIIFTEETDINFLIHALAISLSLSIFLQFSLKSSDFFVILKRLIWHSFYFPAHLWSQCDQIGRFEKVICYKFYYKSAQNIWQLYGLLQKHNFLSNNYCGSFLGNLCKIWVTFYSNIWSLCLWTSIYLHSVFLSPSQKDLILFS